MKNKKIFLSIIVLFALAFIIYNIQSANKKYHGLATGKPGMNVYNNKAPGETNVLKRLYKIAPPIIPHDISDFKITRNNNDCLSCHLEGEEIEPGHIATKIPKSHFINKFTAKKTKDKVTGIRYNCLQCHIIQSNDKVK